MLALTKSAKHLQSIFARRVAGARLSSAMRERIEEALLEADLGYETAQEIAKDLAATNFHDPESLEELQARLREIVTKKLRACETEESSFFDKKGDKKENGQGLFVIVLIGLNGCGKTSTAGKLAARFQTKGAKVLLAAGDTFRAAATQQLQAWATRSRTELVSAQRHSDPAALAFDALAQARAKGCDILIVDTAGRQDSDANLMQQLAKIERALVKQSNQNKSKAKEPRIEFWLVLDATLGQTLFSQVRRFVAVVPVCRLLLTKLDSSARAGALVALAQEKKPLPVQYLTLGENLQDLTPFRAQDFAEALIDFSPAPSMPAPPSL